MSLVARELIKSIISIKTIASESIVLVFSRFGILIHKAIQVPLDSNRSNSNSFTSHYALHQDRSNHCRKDSNVCGSQSKPYHSVNNSLRHTTISLRRVGNAFRRSSSASTHIGNSFSRGSYHNTGISNGFSYSVNSFSGTRSSPANEISSLRRNIVG